MSVKERYVGMNLGWTPNSASYTTAVPTYGTSFLPPRGLYTMDRAGIEAMFAYKIARCAWVPYSHPSFLGEERIVSCGREVERARRRRGEEPDVIMKGCHHRKIGFINLPCTCFYIDDVTLNAYKYFQYYLATRLPVYWANWITDAHLVLPDVDTRAMSSRAWWTMQPRFEGEISMLNFLFELKDFRDIAKYALKLRSGFVWDRFMASLRKSLPEIAAQPTKTAAQLHLANEFAIKPLISDVLAIDSMLLSTVDYAQSQFAESGSKYQKKHYSEVINQDGTWTNGTSNNALYTKRGNVTVDRFTATLRYQYKYNVRDIFSAFVRYWGLRPTAEVIWNGIPFSFLADYFFKIGNSLKAMELDPNVTLLNYQYCESIKRRANCGVVGHIGHPSVREVLINSTYTDDYEDYPISGYFGSVYSRMPCKPNRGLYIPRIVNPKIKSLWNMAALTRCFL